MSGSQQQTVPGRRLDERGVVLVIALLTLVLLSMVGAAFVTVTGVQEKSMSSQQTIATQALFSADAGIEVAKQQMANYAQSKLDSLLDGWGGSGPIIARPDSFFPAAGFSYSTSNPNLSVTTTFSFLDSALVDTSQTFDYNFTSRSTGTLGTMGRRVIACEGKLRISASRASLADFLLFTDTHSMPDGGAIWFTTSTSFSGRVHTNTEFRFAYSPTFADLATSVNQNAWYYNNGYPLELNADRNGTTDVPNFYGGFTRGVPEVELPPNAFSQQRAALGGDASNTSTVTNLEIRRSLGLDTTQATPPPTGIYIPHSDSNITGGIYIQSNVNQALLNISSNKQVYTIKDANNNTCTITLDRSRNETTVTGGQNPGTYTGLPRGIIYDEGQISDLRGPDRSGRNVPPAIDDQNQLSIVAKNDVIIQRDITYEDYRRGQNVLSIFSSTGDIRIGTSAPNDMNLDAFVMAAASGKVFAVDNYNQGSYRGVLHLRGGVVQNYYGAFGTFGRSGPLTGYGRDFQYDSRGFVPPYYPIVLQYTVDAPAPQVLAWREE